MPQIFSAQTNFSYKNIATATTTVVKAAPGLLRKISVNLGTAAVVTLYDNASAASGTKIATFSTTVGLITLAFDINFVNGLTIVTAGTPDLTVVYN